MSKKARKAREGYYNFLKYGEINHSVLDDDYDIMEDLDMFHKEMKDVSEKRKADKKHARKRRRYRKRYGQRTYDRHKDKGRSQKSRFILP